MRLITAATVLPGPDRQRLDEAGVLLDGDTIVAVGPTRELEHHPGAEHARRENYPASTITPGLINAHVHLCFDPSTDPAAVADRQPEELLLDMAGRAQQLLDAGVTTARDLGDRNGLALHLRNAIERGELLGPRLLCAGAPLTVPGGHCWFLGGEVDGHDAMRTQVRRAADAGADLIKIMVSGGQITESSPPMWQSQFTPDDLRVLAQAAQDVGLPIAAHAHGTEAITAAVDVGVRTVEHCTWMSQSGFDRREDVARRMAANGIVACAASSQNWPALLARAPERARQAYGRLSWLDSLGVPLITGTDAGLPHSPFSDLAGALSLYTDYLGFRGSRVIEMATTTGAEALGLGATVGRLAPGYSADLLVLRRDPTTHGLEALQERQLLLVRGQQVPAPATADENA